MGIFQSKSISENFNSNYIDKSYLNDYNELSNIYKRFYKSNSQGTDSLMFHWVELIISQPTRTYIINDLAELSSDNIIEDVKENIKILIDNFKKIYKNDSANSSNLSFSDYDKIIESIISSISNREPGHKVIKLTTKYCLTELLQKLKKDISILRKKVSDHIETYKDTYRLTKLFINTYWITRKLQRLY